METIILIAVLVQAFGWGFMVGYVVATPKLEPAQRYDPTELSDEDIAWANTPEDKN